HLHSFEPWSQPKMNAHKSLLLIIVALIISPVVAQNHHQTASLPRRIEIEKLNNIGREISQALLQRDAAVILKYDRADLRNEDSQLLRDNKSDLYCYLFETKCIQWKAKSIYDQFREMNRAGIAVKQWGKSAQGHPAYLLVFYDSAKLNRDGRLSANFICS